MIETKLFREELRFVLNLSCAHERMAFFMGHYESETSDFLAELYDGGSVVDVGANIGLVALPLAVRSKSKARNRSGPHVFALEPLAGNFRVLLQNIRLNGLDTSVKALNIGVGSAEGDVFIQIEGDDPERTGTGNILPREWDFQKMPLHIKTIDQLVSEGELPGDVALMKIDTDGYDYEVLKGAHAVLRHLRPVVFAELMQSCMTRWHGYGIDEVARYLRELKYETCVVTSVKPLRCRQYRGAGDYRQDCLLVPTERASELGRYLTV